MAAFDRHADPIGAVQSHLQSHSKLIADSLYELQQLRAPNGPLVQRVACGLNASADRLEALILALPEYEMDAEAAARFVAAQGPRYAERADRLEAQAGALLHARLRLAAGAVGLLGGAPSRECDSESARDG